jgi:hypothetical protein
MKKLISTIIIALFFLQLAWACPCQEKKALNETTTTQPAPPSDDEEDSE